MERVAAGGAETTRGRRAAATRSVRDSLADSPPPTSTTIRPAAPVRSPARPMLLVMATPSARPWDAHRRRACGSSPASHSSSHSSPAASQSSAGPSQSSAAASPASPRRPRRPRCRWSAAAKLPKMTNSERGKFYRQKYKDYERALERDVLALRARVRELELLAALRRRLRDDLRVADAGAVAAAVLARLDALQAGADGGRDAVLAQWVRADGGETETRFELAAAAAEGCADAPVVRLDGRLRVLRTPSGHELAAHTCAFRLLFSADCARHELVADVDAAGGLCTPMRRLALDVKREPRPEVRPEARKPAASRLPGVRQLLRVAAQHRDGYSSAGAADTDAGATSSPMDSLCRRRRSIEAPARLASAPLRSLKTEPSRLEDGRRRLGKRPRAMTLDFILS